MRLQLRERLPIFFELHMRIDEVRQYRRVIWLQLEGAVKAIDGPGEISRIEGRRSQIKVDMAVHESLQPIQSAGLRRGRTLGIKSQASENLIQETRVMDLRWLDRAVDPCRC